MSSATKSYVQGAEVHEAPSIESSFNRTNTLIENNESINLGLNGESKIMLLLKDLSLRCEAVAPTSTEKKQHVVMIIKKSVVVMYRLEQKSDTLRRVPDLVKFFDRELREVIEKTSWETGYRMILASQKNWPDSKYRDVYLSLGEALQEEFSYPVVTCYQYQDGSALRAGFTGNPYAWPECNEEKAGGGNLKKINYFNVGLDVYSLND